MIGTPAIEAARDIHTPSDGIHASRAMVSTVLVFESDPIQRKVVEMSCVAANLSILKIPSGSVAAFLRSQSDLGGVLLSEDYRRAGMDYADVAREIHALRPELPIILRRASSAALNDLAEDLRPAFHAAYATSDLAGLRRAIDRHIFTLHYPEVLLAGIMEISQQALASEFSGFEIEAHIPTVVHDRVVFGELFSLIPLESDWCRGYLMLQTDQSGMLDLLNRSGAGSPGADLRSLNDRLREATNLMWGLFKNRYVGDRTVRADANMQVPLVFSLADRSVSFGAFNAHLCFRYRLKDVGRGVSIDLLQRFVFNLNWSPDDFVEIVPPAGSGVGSGGLEFF